MTGGKDPEGVSERSVRRLGPEGWVSQLTANFPAQEVEETLKAEAGSCTCPKGAFLGRPGLTENGWNVSALIRVSSR